MAIEKTYLLGKNITLGCGFDLQAKAPLDSRQVVPEYDGLQALIDGNAAYEGMIVYDEGTKKTYQAQLVDGVLAFREFGINEAELKALIASETTAAMEFKGAATALPENPAKGDFYKVTTSFDVAEGETAKIGDSIVYDGEQWFIIPSGDDIEDTWRPVTDVNNDATLTFVAGDKLEKTVAADGTITYKHEAIDAPTATPVGEDEQTRTYITEVMTDGHGHITGYKTATENVEDTNTEYTFEGQSDEATSVYFQVTSNEEGASAEVIYLDAYSKNEADGKFVAKEEGKSLISDTEIARLADVDNYDDEEVRGLIGDNADAIDELAKYVGTIPNVPGEDGNNKYADLNVIGYINKKAQETLAAASGNSSETAASVKGQLDDYIGENNTRVKAIEDDVAAIKDAETGILKQAQEYADGLAGNYDEAGAAAGVKSELEGEIAKKVTAVEGKDLIATSEIERLATLANYDDTKIKEDISKKVDAETGKSLVADSEITKLSGVSAGANKVEASTNNGRIKIDGVETAVYTHPDKHAIADVDGLQAALNGLQAKGDYADKEHTHTKSDITDFAHTHTKSEITDFDHTHTASNITDFAAEVAKVKVNEATKADSAAKVENALTVKVGGADVVFDGSAAKTADVDAAIEAAISAIPEQTDYTVSIEEDTTDSTIAKRYIFKQLGEEIGRIDLAKELVVTSGSVKEVETVDTPYAGAKVGDKYIELAIANQTAPIYIPAKDLVDIYTAKGGAAEVQVAISNTNEISATLVNGGIAEEKLAEAVKTKLNKTWEEVGVAQGLVNNLADGQVKTNKEAIENITKADGLIATAKAEAIAAAKNDAANLDAVVLSEAQKYTDAAEDRLEALLTWGTF